MLLKAESLDNGKVNSTTTFADFVEVGGSWWARSVTTTDAKGRKTSETRFEISSLDKDKYGKRLDAELAAKPQAQFLHLPGPTLDVARQHVADGSADFEDRITMMLHNCLLQQWDELLKQLDAAEKLAAGKPGVRWIRTVVLQTIRRNNEARLRLLDEARKLVASEQPEEMFLVDFIIGQSRGVASPAEQLEFVNILRPVYERQPDDAAAKIHLQEQLLSLLRRFGPQRRCARVAWQTGGRVAVGYRPANRLRQASCCEPASPMQHTPGCKSSSIATSSSTAGRTIACKALTPSFIARKPAGPTC